MLRDSLASVGVLVQRLNHYFSVFFFHYVIINHQWHGVALIQQTTSIFTALNFFRFISGVFFLRGVSDKMSLSSKMTGGSGFGSGLTRGQDHLFCCMVHSTNREIQIIC